MLMRRRPCARSDLRRQRALLMPASPMPFLVGASFAVVLPLLGLCSPPAPLLEEEFAGGDGVFVSAGAFWNSDDLGEHENPTWLSESGAMLRRDEAGRVEGGAFRMWTRDPGFAFSRVDLDVTFHGWAGGSASWHGINLWLNASLCIPAGDCSKIDDAAGGTGGYAVDFMNRNGVVTVLKKVPGDTRGRWAAGATGHTQGGTYYELASARFHPADGRTYRLTGSVADDGRGGAVLQVLVDGGVVLDVVDDGSKGGPPLSGGRVGFRTDSAVATVDDVEIHRARPAAERSSASVTPPHDGGSS